MKVGSSSFLILSDSAGALADKHLRADNKNQIVPTQIDTKNVAKKRRNCHNSDLVYNLIAEISLP